MCQLVHFTVIVDVSLFFVVVGQGPESLCDCSLMLIWNYKECLILREKALEKVPFTTRCQAKESHLFDPGRVPLPDDRVIGTRNEHILLHADAFAWEKGMDGWAGGRAVCNCD